MAPVSAPLVMTDQRALVEASVAVSGPVAKISTFSGLRGSACGSMFSNRYLLPSPRWPMYFAAQSRLSGSTSIR